MATPFTYFTHWITVALFDEPSARRRFFNRAIIVFIGLLPTLLLAGFGYYKAHVISTSSVFIRREVLTRAAAAAASERLDRVVESMQSITLRPEVPGMAARGEWQEIIDIAATLKPFLDPFIDRIIVSDAEANGGAAYPELAGWAGKNFAHRDWYQGIMRTGGPYVSEIYRRVSAPEMNVVSIAVPIQAENHRLVGILLAQVMPERLASWASEFAVGPQGVTYFVDQHGRVVAHPNLNPQREPLSLGEVDFVRKVTAGQEGITETRDPVANQDAVIAYAPVSHHGWGVVVSQLSTSAFTERTYNLRLVAWIFGSLIFFNIIFIALLLSAVTHACVVHRSTTPVPHNL